MRACVTFGTMRPCAWLLAVVALVPVPAVADAPSDADIAQHYFAAGREAYAQARYQEALEAFRSAARLVPRAELDYDIGLCAEHLGRREEAAQAYARFLQEEHDSASDADVELRLRALRGEPPSRRGVHIQTAAISMAAATVALAAIAGGLIGIVGDEYDTLKTNCGAAGQCAPASYRGVYERDVASKVLFGTAGVAAAIDVGFWVAWARARRGAGRIEAKP
jgi:tetratricopeptide (TPR) repeat protein